VWFFLILNLTIMNIFDTLYFNVFTHYKTTHKAKAKTIALYYITLLQILLLLLFGLVLAIFLKQMSVSTMSSSKVWTLFIIASLIILFKNWMQYSGKKRYILNAQYKKQESRSIWVLWMLPIGCLLLSILFMNVL
jgi:hypothetical protein